MVACSGWKTLEGIRITRKAHSKVQGARGGAWECAFPQDPELLLGEPWDQRLTSTGFVGKSWLP